MTPVDHPRTNTRAEILKLAEGLFQTKGYNGFSYSDISSVLGIKNAAIHYHFPSKAELGVALIRRYRDLLKATSGTFMKTGENPRAQLEGYLLFCAKREQTTDYICPIAITANDYMTLPKTMQDEGIKLSRETLAWLTRILQEGREQGVFTFDGYPADKAILIQGALQGAGELCRLKNPRAMDATTRQIKSDLSV